MRQPAGSAPAALAAAGKAAMLLLRGSARGTGEAIFAMLRRWRLVTGLLLLGFVATHLLNHALGLAGLAALEAGRTVFLALWRNPPAEALLLLALLLHLGLAGQALYSRKRFGTLRPWEAAQLLLGLLVPPLIALHILGTTVAHQLYGTQDHYSYLLLTYLGQPWEMARQFLALAVAWTHGAIGLWFWLRLRRWFPRWRNALLAALLLWPAVALGGILAALREVTVLSRDPAWLAAERRRIAPPDPEAAAWLYQMQDWLLAAYALLLAAVLAARGLKRWRERRGARITVRYPSGLAVTLPKGSSILEASLLGRVPHAHVCGGRGRCSTCRVRVVRGREQLPPPGPEEQRVLKRLQAGPALRLACQTRPHGDVEVVPLLPAGATPRDAGPRPGYLQGQEREIVVLFADLRGFTALSEQKLPYDVVFLLNRYFRGMAEAVEGAGGRIDKFIGDGVMALFGLGSELPMACRQALAAARAMAAELRAINRQLTHDLPVPLKLGIGLHAGPAIVGEMGAGQSVTVTAIGDTVNTASRLESLTKELGAELVVSRALVELAGTELPGARPHLASVRGRREALPVLALADATALPEAVAG